MPLPSGKWSGPPNNPTMNCTMTKPVSWLGISEDGTTARICGWCPTKGASDVLAGLLGLSRSHGICPACAERVKAEALAFHGRAA